MTNAELSLKFEAILLHNNLFDQLQALNEFEKDYRKSDFYKTTKMSLKEVYSYYAYHKIMNMKLSLDAPQLFADLQDLINNLDYTKVMDMLNKINETFEEENKAVKEDIESIQPALDYFRRSNRKEEEINKNNDLTLHQE